MRANTPIATVLLACLAAAVLAADPATPPQPPVPAPGSADAAEAIATPPPRADFLFLPLHVHVLSAPNRPDIDCKLADADLARILSKVNTVWRQAGVQFVVTVHREPAGDVEDFDKMKATLPPGILGVYRALAPPATRDLPGLHVYYVHELPPNGVYLGGRTCFVKETAGLKKVEGGIDEPIPRVTSHELGHALGLPHRQARTNLMASGTTGTSLNEAEAATARGRAKELKGVMTLEEAEQTAEAAEKADENDRARALRKALHVGGD